MFNYRSFNVDGSEGSDELSGKREGGSNVLICLLGVSSPQIAYTMGF